MQAFEGGFYRPFWGERGERGGGGGLDSFITEGKLGAKHEAFPSSTGYGRGQGLLGRGVGVEGGPTRASSGSIEGGS